MFLRVSKTALWTFVHQYFSQIVEQRIICQWGDASIHKKSIPSFVLSPRLWIIDSLRDWRVWRYKHWNWWSSIIETLTILFSMEDCIFVSDWQITNMDYYSISNLHNSFLKFLSNLLSVYDVRIFDRRRRHL